LLSKVSPDQLLRALGLSSVVVTDAAQTVLSQERTLREITGGLALADLDLEVVKEYARSSRLLIRELQLSGGNQAIIVNGRVSHLTHRLRPCLLQLMAGYWPHRSGGVCSSGFQCLTGLRAT